ncbi:hypothetical protein CYMTET_13983 [Cymbomonas tetramitiformis]|uniref:Uncharacterized protein n=1 Tax=Cymbomonas tetramitiformis TaxID=36881 RepID=A0AAE0GHJ1_9CHLO|nr:hypothetical protein CYMTET_13983 [Cymbomonas tetramitiformis]
MDQPALFTVAGWGWLSIDQKKKVKGDGKLPTPQIHAGVARALARMDPVMNKELMIACSAARVHVLSIFTPAEDTLLSMGMLKYGLGEAKSEVWKRIQTEFLPPKEPNQVASRPRGAVEGLCCSGVAPRHVARWRACGEAAQVAPRPRGAVEGL